MNDNPIRVLLIEDNRGDARLIQEILSEATWRLFEMVVAERLSEGLLVLSDSAFDLILLDLSLPDSSGLDTLARIHADSPQTPVVVLTGLDDDTLAIEAVRRGAQDFLVKGHIDAELLSRTIRYSIERKKAEKEKEQLQLQLANAQKMEAIGTLAGGVAHDLNNILTGLINYPELLLLKMGEDNPYRDHILKMKKSGEKAASIVQDLLTLARRGVSVAQVVNLEGIVREYLISPECEKLKRFHPEIRIETRFEDNLFNIMGSPVHLSQTVMNLVSNAAESMPDGGKILISTKNIYLERPCKDNDVLKEGRYVVLTVSDRGTGMSPEVMERIFEPFFTKKVMGRSGTGLGLAVVWGTIKDHSGHIDIKSSVGEGTTFTLYFPATQKKLDQRQDGSSIKDFMGKGETILVVDDVREQREIASELLSELSYSVITVSSGEEAIEYIKNNRVDLLFLDMIMDPGMDGLETYKRILELNPGQKAVIASGYSETELVKEAKRLGAGQFIRKPYTLNKLGMAVKQEFEK
ncbi:MAG: response regulator [Deltaproteobacteria bacterium]|nr:response regulator [Deltaproteobacteria bacterium]